MSLLSTMRATSLVVFAASTVLAQSNSPEAATHPGWVQVPGALVRPDCVHQVPNGAKVDDEVGNVTLNGVLVAHFDQCPEPPVITRHHLTHAPDINGWIEAVQWQAPLKSGQNIEQVLGYWTVPQPPTDSSGLVYLFNGIEPTTGSVIQQPVLQYGNNGWFGGNYWVIASWWAGKSVWYSAPQSVLPGDNLKGVIDLDSTSGTTTTWTVFFLDVTSGANTTLATISKGLQWNWAYAGVLEAYNISSCSQLPDNWDKKTSFQTTVVTPSGATPGWFGYIYATGSPSCGYSASLSGSYQVLHYY